MFHQMLALGFPFRSQQEVQRHGQCLGFLGIVVLEERRIVAPVQLIPADGQFFLELHPGGLGDVGIAELVLVALGIVVHGLFQGLCNADIVDDQATLLAREYTVHTGDGLHQVMPAHGLVHIHGSEGRHVKSREPHITHDGNLHRVVIVLELAGQLLLVGIGTDDVVPLFGVLVAGGHHHLHLLLPFRTELQHLPVYLDAYPTCQCHNHGLARQMVGTVFFVMADDVAHQ